jgi:dual specificity tyrosine-phosphorylation-regulated kinase 1
MSLETTTEDIQYDDEDGNYLPTKGEEINQRYVVEQSLGSGSFGVVVKAYDTISKAYVAIKLIKNKEAFYKQAQYEIAILRKVHETKQNNNIVLMREYFDWRNHLCIVTELLYINLYELLKHTNFSGVSLNLTRKFAYQILVSLCYLRNMDIIHCDLKPENILLKSAKNSSIKLIDFGSSCYYTNRMFTYIQSRFYRSPEVLLGLPYDCAIDMWSLGCILVELHTGVPIFDGKNEGEQIGKIIRILGHPPNWMIEKMSNTKRKDNFAFDLGSNTYTYKGHIGQTMTLSQAMQRRNGTSGSSFIQSETETDFGLFLDLVKLILLYDPVKRIKPHEALKHEFFKNCKI